MRSRPQASGPSPGIVGGRPRRWPNDGARRRSRQPRREWNQAPPPNAGWRLACLWLAVGAAAQARAPLPVDDDKLVATIEARCAALREKGALVHIEDLHPKDLPRSVELRLGEPSHDRLEPPDLYERARASALLVGVFYRCTECESWHFDAASGFVLDADGAVATCFHVFELDAERRETFCVVADDQGEVWPIKSLLAADPEADVCIVGTEAKGRRPLPVRAGARVGERVWCVSNPDHRFAFFSEGMIARSFVSREPPADDTDDDPAADAGPNRVAPVLPAGTPAYEVTLDFALGSSGAGIVDACGNVVALAQATTTIVYDPDAPNPDVQMVVKIAAPAAALRGLVRPPK
ncbi:MAG: serine protease [Planctomycetota bacterium]